jgi:serine/threonine-protein kinase
MTGEQLLGQQLGPYRIESILGKGGMAVVYRAQNVAGEWVALKVLFPPPGAGPEVLARFEREARTAARLRHSGIVHVLEAGQEWGYAFMAMALIEGPTLADRLAQVGALDETSAADIAWQIADVLDYAHRQGVVHRDVKPSNILLAETGQVLLTDFGVAQALDDLTLTRTGYTVGTPAYMAPEQTSSNQPVDGRADLYALGVVLYQMVTGRTPFRGSTPQVLHAHVYEPPPPPSTVAAVSPAMESIILKALAKEVGQRFQSGAAMAQALAGLDDQTAVLPMAMRIQPNSAGRSGFGWLGWSIALGAILAALLVGAALWAKAPWTANSPSSTASLAPTPLALVTPTATPSPLPTTTTAPATPLPSPTALPPLTPTATPTLTPPPPPSPTLPPSSPPPLAPAPSPSPTPTTLACSFTLSPTLALFLERNPPRIPLGCPRAEAFTTAAARQPFENGLMLWRQDMNLIYGLMPDQSWFFTGDTWREGDPSSDPAIIPPAGLYQPVRGFGKVWRERFGVRQALGWATAEEVGFSAIIQEFTGGVVWQEADQSTGLMLFNDGSYQAAQP